MRSRAMLALAGLCALTVGVAGQSEAAARRPAASLAARLQVLEDRAAIEDLLEAYTAALDSSNWNAYADVFAKDGKLDWIGQTMNGREEIRKRMSQVVLATPRRAGVAAPAGAGGAGRNPQRHILSNIQIKVDGDHATTAARWTLIVQLPDGKDAVDSTGRYADQLVRENGQWKFAHRIISGDIPIS